MVDTLIITLALANALNLEIPDLFDESFFRKQVEKDTCNEALLASFSAMCKLAEAREHHEELPYDQMWRAAFTQWVHALLRVVQQFPPDLIGAISKRWKQVESSAR